MAISTTSGRSGSPADTEGWIRRPSTPLHASCRSRDGRRRLRTASAPVTSVVARCRGGQDEYQRVGHVVKLWRSAGPPVGV